MRDSQSMFCLHCIEFSWHPFSRSHLTREFFYSTEHLFLPSGDFQFWDWGDVSSWFVAGNWMLMLNHPLTSTGHWNHLPSLGGFVLNYRSSTELQVRHSPNKSLTHHISHGKAIIRQLNCCPYPTGLFQRMSLFVFLSYLSKFSLTF